MYPYDNFNHDLTTVSIEDLTEWAIEKGLSPRFLQIPIAKFKKPKGKNKTKGKKKKPKQHKEFTKEVFYILANSSTNKLPTYIEIIKEMIDISISNADNFEYDGVLIEDPSKDDILYDSKIIYFVHNKTGHPSECSIKTIKSYLTEFKKNYVNNS